MRKRSFRQTPASPSRPAYPTLDDFDEGRRSALLRLGALGAALLGAGSLLGCSDRSVGSSPDGKRPPDGGVSQPEGLVGPAGVAPMPDAREDQQPPRPRYPDANILEGDVAGPDARIDEPDAEPMAGGAPLPPAKIDAR